MKIIYIIFSVFICVSLNAQDSKCSRAKKELDSVIFNWEPFEKFFEPMRDSGQCIFKAKRQLMRHLDDVSMFNSVVGRFMQNEIIKVHFGYTQTNKVKDALFFYQGKNISISFDPSKDGFVLNQRSGWEGQNRGFIFTERKNNEKDGVEIDYYFSPKYIYDTFLLEKKFYKNGLQTGRYLSYHINGQIKVEGDSVIPIYIRKLKMPHYNSRGEIDRYIFVKDSDIEKKGIWKYYDPDGKLIKEETY